MIQTTTVLQAVNILRTITYFCRIWHCVIYNYSITSRKYLKYNRLLIQNLTEFNKKDSATSCQCQRLVRPRFLFWDRDCQNTSLDRDRDQDYDSCSLSSETETINLIVSVTRPRLRPRIFVLRLRLRPRLRLNSNGFGWFMT